MSQQDQANALARDLAEQQRQQFNQQFLTAEALKRTQTNVTSGQYPGRQTLNTQAMGTPHQGYQEPPEVPVPGRPGYLEQINIPLSQDDSQISKEQLDAEVRDTIYSIVEFNEDQRLTLDKIIQALTNIDPYASSIAPNMQAKRYIQFLASNKNIDPDIIIGSAEYMLAVVNAQYEEWKQLALSRQDTREIHDQPAMSIKEYKEVMKSKREGTKVPPKYWVFDQVIKNFKAGKPDQAIEWVKLFGLSRSQYKKKQQAGFKQLDYQVQPERREEGKSLVQKVQSLPPYNPTNKNWRLYDQVSQRLADSIDSHGINLMDDQDIANLYERFGHNYNTMRADEGELLFESLMRRIDRYLETKLGRRDQPPEFIQEEDKRSQEEGKRFQAKNKSVSYKPTEADIKRESVDRLLSKYPTIPDSSTRLGYINRFLDAKPGGDSSTRLDELENWLKHRLAKEQQKMNKEHQKSVTKAPNEGDYLLPEGQKQEQAKSVYGGVSSLKGDAQKQVKGIIKQEEVKIHPTIQFGSRNVYDTTQPHRSYHTLQYEGEDEEEKNRSAMRMYGKPGTLQYLTAIENSMMQLPELKKLYRKLDKEDKEIVRNRYGSPEQRQYQLAIANLMSESLWDKHKGNKEILTKIKDLQTLPSHCRRHMYVDERGIKRSLVICEQEINGQLYRSHYMDA